MQIISENKFFELYLKGEEIPECEVSIPEVLPTIDRPTRYKLADQKILKAMYDYATKN